MMPILIISANDKDLQKYLKKIITKDSIFFEITPEKKQYSIENIREIIKESSVFHKEKRIYFFKNFHQSSLDAQNAFLKFLEEPPSNTLIILTTDNENKLLPTIISRVKIIRLNNEKKTELKKEEKDILNNFLKNKNYQFSIAESIDLDKLIIFFKDKLKQNKKAPIVLKEILNVKTLLEKNNLNQQLAIDHLLIFIKKIYKL